MLHETKHVDHPGITKFFHDVHVLYLKVRVPSTERSAHGCCICCTSTATAAAES
jgi:hypothetical protein